MEILSHEKLVGVKILVILAKIDLTDRKKLNYLKFMMRLDTVVAQAGKRVSLLEVSSTSGDGIEDVRKWLVENWPKPIQMSQQQHHP
jgi:selenocysteine-specific translation elongation factor